MQEKPLDINPSVYSGNGNILGIIWIDAFKNFDDIKNHLYLRKKLSDWGIENNVDSIMVLIDDPALFEFNDYHFGMYVFEPRGSDNSGLSGSWSAMCGNGVMAVALFFENNFKKLEVGENVVLNTLSGSRVVEKISDARYCVKMGEFTNQLNDLKNYVNSNFTDSEDLCDIKINENINLRNINRISIGLSGDRDENSLMNGEPHAVVILDQNEIYKNLSISEKRQIIKNFALENGPKITKNLEFFPLEINANFAYVDSTNIDLDDNLKNEMRVICCTHERGLGDDPDHSITGACGTGSTAIGATLYRLFNLEDNTKINIYMPAATLIVFRSNNQFFLTGSAKKIQVL